MNPAVQSDLQSFPLHNFFIYDLVGRMQPSFCLDIGAASGTITKAIKDRAPNARVIAFEPFPGNHNVLDAVAGNLAGVTIVKAAVGDAPGPAPFFWSSKRPDGRSNVGYLLGGKPPRRPDHVIDVPVVVLDDMIDEHVNFMKIDVQGGEPGVLRGARKLITEHGVDIMYVEFSGNPSVLTLLHDYGFELFDTEYTTPREDWAEEWLLDSRAIERTTKQSFALKGKLKPGAPREFAAYSAFISESPTATDLVAVHSSVMPRYRQLLRDIPR